MQTAKLRLASVQTPEGRLDASKLPLLRELVDRYPYYHAARMLLLRLLYQLRDSRFNEELHLAALYLPSRAKVYEEIEGESMRPKPEEKAEKTFAGAAHARKSKKPIEAPAQREAEDRTGNLIDTFLGTPPSVLMDARSGRPVDATTDYIGYMMQEEAALARQRKAQGTSAPASKDTTAAPSQDIAPTPAVGDPMQDCINDFINTHGDQRIRLTEKKDGDLQKPTLTDNESGGSQGAFTETLAKIYIKQGKYEQAIEIIKRLSLKYPKKNRYFADQIRFLEKLVLNSRT